MLKDKLNNIEWYNEARKKRKVNVENERIYVDISPEKYGYVPSVNIGFSEDKKILYISIKEKKEKSGQEEKLGLWKRGLRQYIATNQFGKDDGGSLQLEDLYGKKVIGSYMVVSEEVEKDEETNLHHGLITARKKM